MAYYATLAAKGFIPEEWLAGWASYDSPLGHHPDRVLVPGVEISSGSLGHGLPLGVGTALGLRAQGIDARVVVLVGDAELDEGSNAEAVELAGALGLDALTVVVGRQRLDQLPPAGGDRRRGSPTRAGMPRSWTAATTTPWSQALTRTRHGTAGRGRGRGGGEVMSGPEADVRADRRRAGGGGPLGRAGLRRDLGPVLRRRASAGTRTGWSTSASASSCCVNVGAGLALSGMRPIVHTFALVPGRARLRAGQARLRSPGRRRGPRRLRRLLRRQRVRAHPPGTGGRRAARHARRLDRARPRSRRRGGRRAADGGRRRRARLRAGGRRSRTPSRARSPLAASTSYGAGRARRCSRSARCSTRCWPRSRGAT